MQQFSDPAFDGHAQFVEMALEEMISGDKDEFFGVGGLGYNFFQQRVRAVLIAVAADEEFWLGAVLEKRIGVQTTFGFDRRADGDESFNVGVRASGSQPGGRAKENPAKRIGNANSLFSHASAVFTSSISPRPWSCCPALRPVPRKLKRRTGKPNEFSAFMAWKTTLLCIVPPPRGCG